MGLTKAKRQKIKVPIFVNGPSGSGKTVSSLFIAKGIVEKMFPDLPEEEHWDKIAIIDTEHKRSLLYADTTIGDTKVGEFLHYNLEPPYSVSRYTKAFEECKAAGVEVVIIDSITHAWSGDGGILDMVESFGGNFSAWNKVKPQETDFMKMLVEGGIHVIATGRTKQGYEVGYSETGKLEVKKLGLKVEQKDNLEYEFAIVFRTEMNHQAIPMKDNSNLFKEAFRITKDTGHIIHDWAEVGIDKIAEDKKRKQELDENILELVEQEEMYLKKLEELEYKASKKLEEFNLSLTERAYELIKNTNTNEKDGK